MNAVVATLPTGRRGQALAVGLAIVAVALLWAGVVSPLLDWYGARAELLGQRQVLAARMADAVAATPALQAQATAGTGDSRAVTVDGATEALAGAVLQQRLQDMTEHASMRMTSAEVLAAEQRGDERLVRVHLALSGPWTRLVSLLADIDRATPRMLVAEMQIGPSRSVTTDPIKLLDVSLSVEALYARREAAK